MAATGHQFADPGGGHGDERLAPGLMPNPTSIAVAAELALRANAQPHSRSS